MFTSTYQVGDVATVRIVKLMTFGAFAEIVPGVDGLIHISQIADHRIDKPSDVLAEGQIGGREDHRHRLWTTRRSPCPSAPCSTTPAPLTGTSTTTNFRTSTAETNTKKGELPLRQFPFFCWERAAEVCGPYTAPTEYEKCRVFWLEMGMLSRQKTRPKIL